MRWAVISLVLGFCACVGCEEAPVELKTHGGAATSPPLPKEPAGPPAIPNYPIGGGTWDEPQVSGRKEKTERVKAQVGVGKKGQRLDNPELVRTIVTPARTLFRVQEWMAFDVQLKTAMNHYKAINGHMPKSHREFVDNVIIPNSIRLPELPQGQRYVYDPKTEELMVEKPAR